MLELPSPEGNRGGKLHVNASRILAVELHPVPERKTLLSQVDELLGHGKARLVIHMNIVGLRYLYVGEAANSVYVLLQEIGVIGGGKRSIPTPSP